MSGTSKQCFDEWLEKFSKCFVSLDDTEKNITLMKLVKLSGPVQLQFLSDKLEILVKRDFLKSLPPELCFHVIKWLDCGTLCCCCLVSKEWNKVISSCNKAWMKACEEIGVVGNISEEETELEIWKLKYVSAIKRLTKLRNKSTFTSRKLFGHTARVFALNYKDGFLASGSDDRTVRLWNLSSGDCEYLLSCHSCADLKFDTCKVLTASFDNTLALWEWSSGNCIVKFQGHVGAVFCVDYNEDLDLVVSGSSDCTVKLWQMSTGSCLVTRSGHEDWVTSILLQKVDFQSCITEDYIIISMDRSYVKIWSTTLSANLCIATLCCDGELEGSLRPRLLCNGKHIMCSSGNGVCIWELGTFQLARLFTTFHNLWLVAHGQLFSILLDTENLYILNNKTEHCIAKIAIVGMRKSLRGSNFLGANLSWLDDCNAHLECDVVFATSNTDHSIYVVKWNNTVSTNGNLQES